MTALTIGVDVGGTFTDLVAVDETGRAVFAKAPSTPADQSIGVMAGLDELARRLKLSRAEMLGATERLVHGTTVATNALLERKGAKVALLTTEGHRDVLEMREGLKGNRYDLRSPPPEPLVPRERRFGARERLRPDGDVIEPLDERSLGEAIAAISASGATSVALCFLHAYRNPAHEIAAAERLAREAPELSLSRSSDVLPQIKEYERVSTTVVNAYVGPIVRDYLGHLQRRLGDAGFKGGLFIVLSHGGIAPVDEAARLAAATVLSGPAGGVSGARRCGELLGIRDLVAFDMGGTSHRYLADRQTARRRCRASGELAGQRIALRSARHREHRGRWRLDRERRRRRHLSRRPGERGRRAGAGLLRPGRHGGRRHRRQCRTRLSRSRRRSWAGSAGSTRRPQRPRSIVLARH